MQQDTSQQKKKKRNIVIQKIWMNLTYNMLTKKVKHKNAHII